MGNEMRPNHDLSLAAAERGIPKPDDAVAPKPLLFADPYNQRITAKRLRSDGWNDRQIAEAMEISIDGVRRLL
jgi:hypothetical protein